MSLSINSEFPDRHVRGDYTTYYTSLSAGAVLPDIFHHYKLLKFPLKIGNEWDYRFDTKKTVKGLTTLTTPAGDFDVYEVAIEITDGMSCTEYVYQEVGLIKKTCVLEGIPNVSFRDIMNEGGVFEKTSDITYRFERVLLSFTKK